VKARLLDGDMPPSADTLALWLPLYDRCDIRWLFLPPLSR